MSVRTLVTVLAMVTLVGVACGSGDDSSESVGAGADTGADSGAADPYGGGYGVDPGAGDDQNEEAATADLDTSCEATSQDGDQVEIEAVDFAFEPACVEAAVDQSSNIVNTGDEVHNFTLERVLDDGTTEEIIDLGDHAPGENSAQEPFGGEGGPGTGTYRLYCKIHESLGMQSVIHVVES